MTKSQLKSCFFYLAYTALTGLFLFCLINLLFEQYYIITDYTYWQQNFTPLPPYVSPESPEMYEYFDVTFSLFLCAIPLVYNAYLILKRKNKKSGLTFFVITAILLYLYGLFKCAFGAFCG